MKPPTMPPTIERGVAACHEPITPPATRQEYGPRPLYLGPLYLGPSMPNCPARKAAAPPASVCDGRSASGQRIIAAEKAAADAAIDAMHDRHFGRVKQRGTSKTGHGNASGG